MKNLFYKIIFYIALAATTCNTFGQFINVSHLTFIKYTKSDLDKRFDKAVKNGNKLFRVWVKVKGKKSPFVVYKKKWPNNIEYTFNVLSDTLNKATLVFASPTSESGDWDIAYVHYFDENGRIIAFERRTGFFNSECTDEAAHETVCCYYDPAFKEILRTYKLTDNNGKNLVKTKCVFNYDFNDYKIYKNLSNCLKGYKLINSLRSVR